MTHRQGALRRLATEAMTWNADYAELCITQVGELQVTALIETSRFAKLGVHLMLPDMWPFQSPTVTILGDQSIDHPLFDPWTRRVLIDEGMYSPAMSIAIFLMSLASEILDGGDA